MFGLLCEGGVNTFWKVVEFYKNKKTLQMEQQKNTKCDFKNIFKQPWDKFKSKY